MKLKLFLGTGFFLPSFAMAAASSSLRSAHVADGFSRRQLLALNYTGENLTPYFECQGDCDSDRDCSWGLNCFQRDGTQPVPGCTGTGLSGKDYCYVPPAGQLVLAGNNNNPASAFPLKECQGDCDFDKECQYGLICLQRTGSEPVPGCTGAGLSGEDYCIKPQSATTLVLQGDNNLPATAFPLGECEGDCDNDDDCEGDLKCFQRTADEVVPGCSGSGQKGSDYCYRDIPPESPSAMPSKTPSRMPSKTPSGMPSKTPSRMPSTVPSAVPSKSPSKYPTGSGLVLTTVASGAPYGECQGNCIDSSQCSWGLNCFTRSGTETVPGCSGSGESGNGYCYVPLSNELVLVDDNNVNPSAYPMQMCQGDCDKDSDCDWGLICYQRSGFTAVPGCSGSGVSSKDYCYTAPSGTLVLMGDNQVPAENFPLGECEGDCDSDSDCAGSLVCFQRSGTEAVPGCSGSGQSTRDYCYDPAKGTSPTISPNATPVPNPTMAPVNNPTLSPVAANPTQPPLGVTYVPGEATVYQNGLVLSTGLTSRIIATKNTKVKYDTGGESTENFHTAPDGAAVFKDDATGGWIYVSNSESSTSGGVGAISFNANGQVVGYKRILSGTRRNCGGGKTFYNTWITCEEIDGGQVWEVDPWGNTPGRQTIMGGAGMNYEAAAYDNRNPTHPTFYITVDESNGPLVKFTPDQNAVTTALNTGDYSNLLHTNLGGTAKYEYFNVTSLDITTGAGTYVWTTSLTEGRASAVAYHVSGEGVDIRNGELFYTTKSQKYLFTINLDNGTFLRTSTVSGAFDNQPDQVARVLDFANGSTDGILYFCEDGGNKCGVHGRDAQGRFFTILESTAADFIGETTGLAFSPDGKFMYVSFQNPGHIFEIKRTDGLPFYGQRLDIKYHQSTDNMNPFRERMLLFEDNAKTCDLNSEMCLDV